MAISLLEEMAVHQTLKVQEATVKIKTTESFSSDRNQCPPRAVAKFFILLGQKQ